jgi:hypothetical protein
MKNILLLGLLAWTLPAVGIPELKNKLFVVACDIYDLHGRVIKNFPGSYCKFLDDGTFISATERSMRRISSDRGVLWEVQGHFHHAFNISLDGKKVLALGSEPVKRGTETLRGGTFLVISVEDGKEIYRQSASLLLDKYGLKPLGWADSRNFAPQQGIKNEMTHFNSIYEIGEVKRSDAPAYLRKGNYVVNGLEHGAFILSSDLKEFLFHFQNPFSFRHYVHDVQVRENGNFLMFTNRHHNNTHFNKGSAIQEVDVVNNLLVFDFLSDPPSVFFSECCGGVQELSQDALLFSDNQNGAYIFSRRQRKLLRTLRSLHHRDGHQLRVQDVKAQDLRRFLSKWIDS